MNQDLTTNEHARRISRFKEMVDVLRRKTQNPLDAISFFVSVFFSQLSLLCDEIGLDRVMMEEQPKFVLSSVLIILKNITQGITPEYQQPELALLKKWVTHIPASLEYTVNYFVDDWIRNQEVNQFLGHIHDMSMTPSSSLTPKDRSPIGLLCGTGDLFCRSITRDTFRSRMMYCHHTQFTFQRFKDRISNMNENNNNNDNVWFIPC